ncbi:response regulator transcription factor [Paenibacillus andongensis]|uniref:response regulator transcription factor n=1 Tax=Paenibacillus andongensis TaxID=2975482 RepID=UPI0021BB3817|nr:response regulator transcription factor [Paenibacillus andongensis]
MLRAIIVDDELLSLKWLKNVLSESGEIEICQTFLSPHEACEYVKENLVHVAFLDISMPEVNGISLSGMLHKLDASIDVVFVTAYDDYAVRAFEISALDYLMKPVTAERLALTLDKLRKKHRIGAAESAKAAAAAIEPLTNREKEILNALAAGMSNGEIAIRFGITEATVKSHVFRLYGKLGVKRRGQAIAKARELNFFE